ncbi:hypothetical protein [Nannocystis pusilla]|uniref:hypothetical protein n=1 Tax=Nannocystis pusilla TaxID=889268 RepID=UPI003B7831B8
MVVVGAVVPVPVGGSSVVAAEPVEVPSEADSVAESPQAPTRAVSVKAVKVAASGLVRITLKSPSVRLITARRSAFTGPACADTEA